MASSTTAIWKALPPPPGLHACREEAVSRVRDVIRDTSAESSGHASPVNPASGEADATGLGIVCCPLQSEGDDMGKDTVLRRTSANLWR